LIHRFIQHLTEAWSGDKNDQQENKKRHSSILRKIPEDCQQRVCVSGRISKSVINTFPYSSSPRDYVVIMVNKDFDETDGQAPQL
jgi:hypothetical protein